MLFLSAISKALIVTLYVFEAGTTASIIRRHNEAPTVKVLNGTLQGQYNSVYQQDFFLGVPFAQPPIGELRFRQAQSINTSWSGVKAVTQYSKECIGYGGDDWVLGNQVSEDCLSLNVIRPKSEVPLTSLPVGVWIHGGGLTQGGNSDPRYNLSFIVHQSVQAEKPFIAVSINYRVHAWGFLGGKEIANAGSGNMGFLDQRLALHWIQENIAAFGGDPSKVTIWGESAGASSVGAHLIAYGGRDDKLFRGAIMESGGVSGVYGSVNASQQAYDKITLAANCISAKDSLECLRQIPVDVLSNIFNSSVTASSFFSPVIDGDFIRGSGYTQVDNGQFVKVPTLHGTNFDEGVMFSRKGINTTEQFMASVSSNVTIATVIAALYPDIPAIGIPGTLKGRPPPSKASLGLQFKRAAAYGGDLAEHAPRRRLSQALSKWNVPTYTYHFNVLPAGADATFGVNHFTEVAFMLYNTLGVGYDNVVATNPFRGAPRKNFDVANVMSRMWVSFIVDLDPNTAGVTKVNWPTYKLENPQNMVFDANVTDLVYVEDDLFRAPGIAYISENLLNPV